MRRVAVHTEHFAQFYLDDEVLLDSVCAFALCAVKSGGAAILVATQSHLQGLESRWQTGGLDPAAARTRGQLIELDARDTLARLMIDGSLSRERFMEVLGRRIAESAVCERLVVFSEMAAPLWQDGQPETAVQLELLWNHLAGHQAFTLFCAYSLQGWGSDSHGTTFEAICSSHTRVVLAERYGGLASDEQPEAVARLRQRAEALRKQLERDRQLEDYRAQLAAIVESSDDAIVSKTLEGRITSWNAGAQPIFGYTAEEAIGQLITLIIPSELHAQEREILEKLKHGERIDHFETARVTKDGRRIPVSLSVSPIRDVNGIVIGASKIARDISDRKAMETALFTSQRRLRTMLDSQPECVKVVAPDGTLLDMNPAGLAMIEADSMEQVRGLNVRELVAPEELSAFQALHEAALAGQPLLTSREFQIVGLHGTRRLMESRSVPLKDESNQITAVLSVTRDITERKRTEQALHASEAQLREADRRKDEFLALLAHELRNPLAPIRYALAANRKSGCTPEKRRRTDEIIDRQVTHMSRLLDDLLDVSRITRGTLELKKGPTELTSVVGMAIETARPLLDAKHHTLALDLPKQAVRLHADAARLAQVFSNLLINAAKYTDRGGAIELRTKLEGREIVVSVSDNGMGIPTEMMPRLFTMFSQANSAMSRAEGGLGVGLSLVRGLVTLHGGTVEASSDGPRRGSEFTVRLPLGMVADAVPDLEVRNQAPLAGVGLKVLVVDDNRDAADTCASLLAAAGHHVQTAYTGRQALELADQFRPHALLLDIGLPDLNGYQLAQRIRAAPWGGATAIIAVTGWGQAEDRRRAFEAGFDHHLTKPIAAEAVESLLQSLGRQTFNDEPHDGFGER